jgi:putative heme transporter
VKDTTLAIAVSGVWNNFVKLGLPVVALGLLALHGEAGAGLAAAAVIGVAVLLFVVVLFTLLLRSASMAARIGALAGRGCSVLLQLVGRPPVEGWERRAVAFRGDAVTLLQRRWLRITVAAVVSHLSLFAVLLIALRHVGVSDEVVSWQLALAAFAFVRLVSAIPVTPGGLGLVELGLTASLGAGLPETTKSQIAAAVLVYRALTWLLPIPLGVGCWLFWRANTTWRRSVEVPLTPATAAATSVGGA